MTAFYRLVLCVLCFVLLSPALFHQVLSPPAQAQGGGTCAAPGFSAKRDFQAENGTMRRIVTADFNQDGRLDLAVTNNGLSVLLGDGNGGFGTAAHLVVGNSEMGLGLAATDFNADGRPDLAVAKQNARDFYLLIGNGNGSFGAPTLFPTGNTEAGNTTLDLVAGEFNGDGKPDLAVANWFGRVSIHLGNGNGGFAAPTNFSAGAGPLGSIAAGDLNQDGKADLVVTNDLASQVSVMLGNGSGGFGAVTSFNAGASPRAVKVTELNSDGKADLVVANNTFSNGGVSVLLGDGAGGFGAPTRVASSDSPISVSTGDFNQDNKPDLAVASFTVNNVAVMLGNGNGGFGPATNYGAGNLPDSIAVGDYNRDGRLDLAVTNQSVGLPKMISVFLNTCGLPTIEVAPASLDFGAVNTGQTKDLTFNVRNTGSGPLTINTISSNQPAFAATAPALPFNVAAGGQQAVTVRFAPTTIGNLSGTFSLTSNDAARPTVTVALTGIGSDPCASTIAPTNQTYPTPGGTGNVAVTIGNGCAWTAASNADWLTITNGGNGIGNGTVNYAVAANLTSTLRTGTLTIAGKSFTVSQAGCAYTLTPLLRSFTSEGGIGFVNVATVSGCPWTATSNAAWLSITSGVSGSGNGTVNFTVAADATNSFRRGTLTIAGQIFTVLQGTQPVVWQRQESGVSHELRSTFFTSETEGWTTGANATLLKTTNGGGTWTSVNTGADPARGFNSVRFVNRTTGFVAGRKALVRTLDAGANWTLATHNIFSSTNLITSLFPLNADSLWLAGGDENTPNNSFYSNYGFSSNGSLTFFEGIFGCCATDSTRDFGVRDLHVLFSSLVWTIDGSGFISLRTGDRFNPVTTQPSGTTQPLNAIYMLNSNSLNSTIGWIVGNNGTILKTTNGGNLWAPQTSATTAHLRDVHFLDANRGCAVGDGGTVLTTSDGGATWLPENSGVTVNLRGVFFVNDSTGYAVGDGGTILKRAINQPSCAVGPVNPRTAATTHLDRSAADWGVYCEGAPRWNKRNVATPSQDGEALCLSLTGGEPYSNAHFYRELLAEPNATGFTLNTDFLFTPNASCNNAGAQPSAVQALEFTMSKWQGGLRYEFAVQWQNVGAGAPQWRYWDPHRAEPDRWVAFNPPLTQCLTTAQWHNLTLAGEISNGQVRYQRFVIDQQSYTLDLRLPPAPAAGEADRIAIAVQLDGNATQTPYDVYLDRTSFLRRPTQLFPTSAASYSGLEIAPDSIAALFGASLTEQTVIAQGLPLPTTLAGISVRVKDSVGTERPAPFFFASPTQINCLIPAATAIGRAELSVLNGADVIAYGTVSIATVAPGIFTANADGQGVPAAQALRVGSNDSLSYESVARFETATNRFVSMPIDLGAMTDRVFLLLYGTGIRGRSSLSAVICRIGGIEVPVTYAGAQGDFAGLDQVNVGPLPRSLAGRGEVDVVLTVVGKPANTVRISVN